MTASVGLEVLVCLAIGGLAYMVYQLMLQNGRLALRLDRLEQRLQSQGILSENESGVSTGLRVGSVLHDFELPALAGGTMTLSHWRGRKILLIFFSPACSFCREMLPALAAIPAPADAGHPLPVIISTGSEEENRALFSQSEFAHPVLLQREAEVASLFWVNTTPAGYLVDENGATASVLYSGAAALLAAVRAADASSVQGGRHGYSRSLSQSKLLRDGLKAGTRAPEFTLPRVDGGELSLESYLGRKLLLVFSDPQCAPCARLAPHLEKLHRSSRDFQVLMISRGDPETNRQKIDKQGLTFPVVLQRHWEISRAYGIFATPVAYLVDEEGFLAADVAVGSEAILKLAEQAARGIKPQPTLAAH